MSPVHSRTGEHSWGLVAFEEHQDVATTWWVLAGSHPAAQTVPVRTQGQGTAFSGTLSLCFCVCASFQPTSPSSQSPPSDISKSRHSQEVLSSSSQNNYSPQSFFKNLLVFCRQLFVAFSVTELSRFCVSPIS